MRKFLCLVLLNIGLLYSGLSAHAQTTVTGTVTGSDNNAPLSDVTVAVKGTQNFTKTNGAGVYSINTASGQVLVFSFVGYTTQEVTVGDATTYNVRLVQSQGQMGEVVVTAYGIRREKKSLGYSTQVVDGNQISQTRRENFINSLAGRVAGANITPTSGVPGASTQIVLRGATSIGGNNQPLIIVDGVIYDNQTLNQDNLTSTFANRNADYGNRGMDINPSDIESVTILKGPEATALYGADGASGAIVVTTRKGKSGRTSVTYDNSFRLEKLYRFPEIQREYTIGRNGIYDPGAVVNPFSVLGTAAGAGIPAAFGPKMPDTVTYDNPGNFFRTGFTQQHNLSLEGGSDISTLRFSANYTDQEGIVPNTAFNRLSLRLTGSTKLLNKINLSSSINYVNSTTDKASKGAGSYLLTLLTWPVTSDVRNYQQPDGTRVPLRNVVNGNYSLEYDNPLWDVYKNPQQDKVDRITGNVTLGVDVTKWLNLGAILGIDYYTQYGSLAIHPLSRFGFSTNGHYSIYTQTTRNINNVFKATVNKNFGDFTNSLVLGFSYEDNNTKVESQKGERFFERDFWGINNTDPLSKTALTQINQVRKVRWFANLVTGFKNVVYLSLAGSREGDSRFMSRSVDKSPYFNYGSGSLSFVFSDLPGVRAAMPWMELGKARISYATTGKGPRSPYIIDYSFATQPTTGGGYAYGVTGNNFDLVPEKTQNLEYGVEFRFFNNRLGIDVARYSLRSKNQILWARSSYGTGFVLKWFNGGLVENRGIEIQLTGTPIRKNNFTWQTIFNFDRNVGTVLEMPAELPTWYESDSWVFGNLRTQIYPGVPIGNMAANTFRRNNAGQVLISPTTGLPVRDEEFRNVGDRQPDFKLGWVNNITYKNFDLSFNLDFRKGGDVFNATEYFLYLTGYSTKTIDRETPRVIEGVLMDGLENTPNPTRNTIAITPMYNSDFFNTSTAIEEDFIENVNWLRLRDITLAYRIPLKSKTVKGLSVFVTGTDLFMITNYSGADPSVNANTASGIGYGAVGIDYGAISTPRGVNLGLRINL